MAYRSCGRPTSDPRSEAEARGSERQPAVSQQGGWYAYGQDGVRSGRGAEPERGALPMPKRGAANLPSDHGLARRGAHQSRDAISGNQVGRKAREVPLNSNARRALRLYLADRPQPQPEDYMFLSDRGGKPLALRTVQAIIHELGQRARIRRLPVT